MALAEAVEQLGLEGVVDGRPELEAGLLAGLDVRGRELARGAGLELGLDVGGKEGAEGA